MRNAAFSRSSRAILAPLLILPLVLFSCTKKPDLGNPKIAQLKGKVLHLDADRNWSPVVLGQEIPVGTELKAKRARAAAGLRTSAAHARWDEFELRDVRPVIDLTRELIEKHLAN